MKCFVVLAILLTIVKSDLGLGGLVGGYTEHKDLLSLSEKEKGEFNHAALKGVELLNAGQNGEGIKFSKVLKVSTQLVAGTNFKFELEVLKEGKPFVCNLVVSHLYPWLGENSEWSLMESSDNACQDVVSPPEVKKPMLGGRDSLDESEQKFARKAANWAVERINAMSNSLFRNVLQKISNVEKQVVNGYLYHMELVMVPSSCRNSDENTGKTLEECPLMDGGKAQICDVSVVDARGEYSMKDFKCSPMDLPVDNLVGGDHDYKDHEKLNHLIGGGDHDYKDHEKLNHLIGGGDHDYKPHEKSENLIGGGNHDYIAHGMDKKSVVHNMKIDGGDNGDYVQHKKCFQYVDDFKMFKEKYNKLYSISEHDERFSVFCDNMEKVKMIQKHEKGTATYGATQFADLTEEEFSKQYLGLKPFMQTEDLPAVEITRGPIPESWDWREQGAVTPVKNQGQCGSCWAFSTTGNIEGQYFIKHKKLISLSEQELVDCDKLDEGCNGGLPSNAYKALMEIGGIEPETDYKYEGYNDKCKFQKSDVAVKLSGAVNISQNEEEMAAWLYHNGPISIGINAFAMQFYFGGIAHPWKMFCNPKKLDHGVLIVGYGVEGNKPYWIIKNSWGPSWGREGYYYVYRGDGTCGLNTMCTSANVV